MGSGVEEEPLRLWALTRRPSPSSCQVVSFFSLKSDSAPPWMVLAVLWCSMAQTLLLPSFIWSCERYRADVRTVWEQCVAIMSEEDGEDGQRRGWAFALPRNRLSFLPFSTSSPRGWGGGCSGVPPAGQNLRFPLDGLIPSPQASPHAHPLIPPLYSPWKPTLHSSASTRQRD